MHQLGTVLEQMRKTISFLRKNGIIHFDCHSHNILCDGKKIYLADFGLVLDSKFDLGKREQDFFRRNTHYDGGEFLSHLLGSYIFDAFGRSSKRAKQSIRQSYDLPDNDP